MSSLALILIARDEARCIDRCLRSAAAFVDEMWVLDTGSMDDTPSVARRCGARVAMWTEREDLAAARNAALALCGSDWRLVMNADEWIGGCAAALQDWCRDATPRIGELRLTRLAGAAEAAAHAPPTWLSRLLPRGVRYQDRAHEQPLSDLPRQRLTLQLLHGS